MLERLRGEYRAIVKALGAAGADFRVLNLDQGDRAMSRWLRRQGCASLKTPFRKITPWQIYPRDLFVYVQRAATLLVHADVFKLESRNRSGHDILHSQWAEGGRVLFAGDRLLVGRHPEAGRAPRAKAFDHLRARGIRITAIPQPLMYQLDRTSGLPMELQYGHHLDRSATLLEGKDGGHYLVLDPGYRTGPLTAPLSIPGIDRPGPPGLRAHRGGGAGPGANLGALRNRRGAARRSQDPDDRGRPRVARRLSRPCRGRERDRYSCPDRRLPGFRRGRPTLSGDRTARAAAQGAATAAGSAKRDAASVECSWTVTTGGY